MENEKKNGNSVVTPRVFDHLLQGSLKILCGGSADKQHHV